MGYADPGLANTYFEKKASGDGNGMVDDMVALKKEETSGQVPDSFSDANAQLLGSQQAGASGKGKVNTDEEKKFTGAFGWTRCSGARRQRQRVQARAACRTPSGELGSMPVKALTPTTTPRTTRPETTATEHDQGVPVDHVMSSLARAQFRSRLGQHRLKYRSRYCV